MGTRNLIAQFVVPIDAADQCEKILAEQGITAFPRSRQITEDLERGTSQRLEIDGLLEFQLERYGYKLEKDQQTCILTVNQSRDKEVPEAFIAALQRAFPTSKVNSNQKAPPKQKIPSDFSLAPFGCILAWIVVSLLCYFAIMGVRSLFFQ